MGPRAAFLLVLSCAQPTAALRGAADHEAMQSGHREKRICALSAVALDFEGHRLADWLAWHNLIGIDCFVLLIDMLHSNLNDPNNADLYRRLQASAVPPFLTLREINASNDIDPGRVGIDDFTTLAEKLDATFVLQIDIDEFVLVDPRETGNPNRIEASFAAQPAFANVTLPCSLRKHLVHVGADREGGMRLQRRLFGTNGYVRPPSLHELPEFGLLTSREGLCKSAVPGKYLCNLRNGCDTKGKHKWHVGDDHPMLMPNGEVCHIPEDEMDRPAHGLCRNEGTAQLQVYINHYGTSSYMHCAYRSRHGSSVNRDRSEEECQQFHPGTEAYQKLARGCPYQSDELMRSYARATRIRVQQLLGDRLDFA